MPNADPHALELSQQPWSEGSLALLAYFLAYFLLAFVWRSWMVYRRTGMNPVVLPGRDDAYGYVGRAFKLVVLAVAGVVVTQAAAPAAMQGLGPMAGLQRAGVAAVGWGLLLASLLWMLVAQAQMGKSWRIGIDENHQTDLVRTGLFAVSRNPIFLAMRVNLLGLFLVLPNAATLGLLVGGELLMQVQVRLEEAHLAGLHGLAYEQYRSTVRRWL
jgi:protein-S-isoprenylcysteine O-methyltransferase Ste14